MAEYKNLSPHLKFQNVDPQEKPEIAKSMAQRTWAILSRPPGTGKSTLSPERRGQPSEQDITSTIMKITRDKVKMVCFVTGHGEKSLTDNEGGGLQRSGSGAEEGRITTRIRSIWSRAAASLPIATSW